MNRSGAKTSNSQTRNTKGSALLCMIVKALNPMRNEVKLFSSRISTFAFRLLFLVLIAPSTYATVDDALSFAYEGATPYVAEGYTFRQDAWGGDLGLKDQKAVTAQLFKGNEYWFIAGTDLSNAIITVHIYDTDGKLVECEFWQKGHFSGAKVVPQYTGIYWAIVTVEQSSEEETPWALVYGFK